MCNATRSLLVMAASFWAICTLAEEQFLEQSDALYKIDESKVTDVLVQLVNADLFFKPNQRYIGEVFLSLYPIGRERHFDCERFYKAIGEQRSRLVNEKMAPYLFNCTDGQFSEELALEKLSDVLRPSITENYELDATWAWFSATGNTDALKRFITNYLQNPNACQECIEWSYSSNYRHNEDVYLYLKAYSMRLVDVEEKIKLFRLAPLPAEN